jgi:hypothetical protein
VILDAMDMTEEEKQQDNRFGEFFAHQAERLKTPPPSPERLFMQP